MHSIFYGFSEGSSIECSRVLLAFSVTCLTNILTYVDFGSLNNAWKCFLENTFLKEVQNNNDEIQISTKHMKECSLSSVIREIQWSHYRDSIFGEKIGKSNNIICFWLECGVRKSCLIYQTLSPDLIELKKCMTQDSIPWYIPPQKCMLICTKIQVHYIYIVVFVGGDIISLLIIFPNWKLSNFISRED